MAGRDGTSDDNKDFKMVPMMDSKGKPVLDGKGKPVMTRKFLTRSEKAEMAKGEAPKATGRKALTSSAPSSSKRPQARPATLGAKEAIDRSTQGPRTRSGPRAKKAETPIATSVTTPEVTTSKLPALDTTLMGYTWEEYKKGNNLGRLRAGLPMGLSRTEFMERAKNQTSGTTPSSGRNTGTAGRAARRANRGMAQGGMVKKSGYAKGGMVKSNCGASMKPTQKGTSKK